MTYFNERDLNLIESLQFDPELEPSYESIKKCLVCEDERPEGMTSEGYEKLCDLWIARSFVHRKLSFASWDLDPKYFAEVWKDAFEDAEIKWPGFRRLKLNEKDLHYYFGKIDESNGETDGL